MSGVGMGDGEGANGVIPAPLASSLPHLQFRALAEDPRGTLALGWRPRAACAEPQHLTAEGGLWMPNSTPLWVRGARVGLSVFFLQDFVCSSGTGPSPTPPAAQEADVHTPSPGRTSLLGKVPGCTCWVGMVGGGLGKIQKSAPKSELPREKQLGQAQPHRWGEASGIRSCGRPSLEELRQRHWFPASRPRAFPETTWPQTHIS